MMQSGGSRLENSVLGQVLTVDADRYVLVDKSQIPIGKLALVAGTPFDFRNPTPIGARIHARNAQLDIADGYDQTLVLNKRDDLGKPQFSMRALDHNTGRTLDPHQQCCLLAAGRSVPDR